MLSVDVLFLCHMESLQRRRETQLSARKFTATSKFRACAEASLELLTFQKKLKGSLLKDSFELCMRIDLPVPLSVPTPHPTLPTPFPFSLIFHRKPPPHHPT